MSWFARSPLGRFGRRAQTAGKGLATLYARTGNARIETLMAYLAVSAALAEGAAWRLGLVLAVSAAVLAAEGLNTAVEFTIDRIGRVPHPLAGQAKDAAAGAVLLAALGAAAVAIVVLVPDVGACWQAFRRASPLAAAAWWAALALLALGVVRPEPSAAKGSGPERRTR